MVLLTAQPQHQLVNLDADAEMLRSRALARARAFATMSGDRQFAFIAQWFSQVDTVELANIIRAIFGHPDDKGRPRKSMCSARERS